MSGKISTEIKTKTEKQ